jgi:hypothetical protein
MTTAEKWKLFFGLGSYSLIVTLYLPLPSQLQQFHAVQWCDNVNDELWKILEEANVTCTPASRQESKPVPLKYEAQRSVYVSTNVWGKLIVWKVTTVANFKAQLPYRCCFPPSSGQPMAQLTYQARTFQGKFRTTTIYTNLLVGINRTLPLPKITKALNK